MVLQRGGCTFAQKVLRAQGAGAVGVVIIQTVDVWPYTMTDSNGESKGATIPAFMISGKQGAGYEEPHQPTIHPRHIFQPNEICRFTEFIRRQTNNNARTTATIAVRKDARECVICQVNMDIGMQVTRMPCQVGPRRFPPRDLRANPGLTCSA